MVINNTMKILEEQKEEPEIPKEILNQWPFELSPIRRLVDLLNIIKFQETINIHRNDLLFQYMVYIPDINMVNRVTSRHDIDNYSCRKCKLYLFTDEIRLKTKIRISLL